MVDAYFGVFLSYDRPFLDAAKIAWATILGRPGGDWDARTSRIRDKLGGWHKRLAARGAKVPENRRGDFYAFASGYSYGQGQTEPCTVGQPSKLASEIMEEFLADPDIQSVLRYADGESNRLTYGTHG